MAKNLIDEDPRRSIRELTELTGLSYGNVHRVINENLQLRKLCAKWVPHLRVEIATICISGKRKYDCY